MQDRYTGDVGDFGKYALLNTLAGEDLSLGVVWYLNSDEESNQDGKFTAYPKLRECDPELYDKLLEIPRQGKRRVSTIEERSILPTGTVFFSEPLSFRDLPTWDRAGRFARRRLWCQRASEAMTGSAIVFMDPDNGLSEKPAKAISNKGQKYVFPEDLKGYIERQQSLIVYHHQTREKLRVQIDSKFTLLKTCGAQKVWALVFRRFSVRVYFVIPAAGHEGTLAERSRLLIESLWGRGSHFQLWVPSDLKNDHQFSGWTVG